MWSKRFLILVFNFSCLTLFSQFEGVIVEDSTGNGLPYSVISFRNSSFGIVADSNGQFVLDTSKYNKALKKGLIKNDSIIISCLGYKRKLCQLDIEKLNCEKLIFSLKPEVYSINEVEINPSKRKFKTGKIYTNKVTKRKVYTLSATKKTAVFFKPHWSNSRLKTITVFPKEVCDTSSTIMLSIMSVNQNGLPDKLISQYVLADNLKAGKPKSIDVLKYNIVLPKEGFFIVLEGVKNNNTCFGSGKIYIKNDMLYAENISNIILWGCKSDEASPISYGKVFDANWHFFNVVVPAIKIEVIY